MVAQDRLGYIFCFVFCIMVSKTKKLKKKIKFTNGKILKDKKAFEEYTQYYVLNNLLSSKFYIISNVTFLLWERQHIEHNKNPEVYVHNFCGPIALLKKFG